MCARIRANVTRVPSRLKRRFYVHVLPLVGELMFSAPSVYAVDSPTTVSYLSLLLAMSSPLVQCARVVCLITNYSYLIVYALRNSASVWLPVRSCHRYRTPRWRAVSYLQQVRGDKTSYGSVALHEPHMHRQWHCIAYASICRVAMPIRSRGFKSRSPYTLRSAIAFCGTFRPHNS